MSNFAKKKEGGLGLKYKAVQIISKFQIPSNTLLTYRKIGRLVEIS